MEPILYDLFFDIEEGHWWWRGRRAIIGSFLERLFPGPGPYRVLDVGCGLGAQLRALPFKFEGYGADSSPQALEGCRRRGMSRIFQVLGPELPFESEFFHAVLALDVLEHLDEEGPLLRNVHRVLRPEGHLLATVPALPWLWTRWDALNLHKRRYRRRPLRAMLERHGYQTRFCSYMNCFLFPLAAFRKLSEDLGCGQAGALPAGAVIPAATVNAALEALFGLERFVLSRGIPLPWGSSIMSWSQRSLP